LPAIMALALRAFLKLQSELLFVLLVYIAEKMLSNLPRWTAIARRNSNTIALHCTAGGIHNKNM